MFRNFIVTLLQNSRNFIHVFIFPGNISCNFLYIKTISYGSTLPKNCKLVSSHLGNTEKYKSPEVYFTLHKKCSFLLRIFLDLKLFNGCFGNACEKMSDMLMFDLPQNNFRAIHKISINEFEYPKGVNFCGIEF